MKLTDEEKNARARVALATAAAHVCEQDSTLSAILLVTDGEGLLIHPLRVSKEQAFSILVAACSALEPEDLKDAEDAEAAAHRRRLN
jgi:hypothetical protein